VKAKLAHKHPAVTEAEVQEALIWTPLLRRRWHDHPERGRRLLVTGITYDGRVLDAVLYPAGDEDNAWWLATAMYRRVQKGHH
jgi:hypothetical protein